MFDANDKYECLEGEYGCWAWDPNWGWYYWCDYYYIY